MIDTKKIIRFLEEKKVVILVICFLVILFSVPLLAIGLRESNALNLRNATDSLILLTELATESSEDCVQAKADHIGMLKKYVKHMESRDKPLTSVLKNDIAKKLKLMIKKLEEDGIEVDQQAEARIKIKMASKEIAEFLSKHRLFMDEPVVDSKLEAVPEEMQTVIKDLLDEAHKKTGTYINNLNMVNSEAAYRANRKAIVYLYLIRCSEWSEIVTLKELRNFRGDINRTIYWNQVLKRSAGINEEEHSRLIKCSVNELRHLRLLHAIIDNDMKDVHGWLRLAIKQAFPDVQFLAEKVHPYFLN